MLDRQIPLFSNRWLHHGIPGEHRCSDDRLGLRCGSARSSSLGGIRCGAWGVVVRSSDLCWRVWRITRQAQIGPRTLQIRRDAKSSTDNGFSFKYRWSPGESNARLKLSESIIFATVESSTEAVLADNAGGDGAVSGKLHDAGRLIDIHLTIVGFDPWSARFIAQSQIQGQAIAYTPIVLCKASQQP